MISINDKGNHDEIIMACCKCHLNVCNLGTCCWITSPKQDTLPCLLVLALGELEPRAVGRESPHTVAPHCSLTPQAAASCSVQAISFLGLGNSQKPKSIVLWQHQMCS